MKALQSPTTFARQAHDRAEQRAEQADDAELAAMIAWAHMREALERLRALRNGHEKAATIIGGTLKACA